jgi:IS30 family transposase
LGVAVAEYSIFIRPDLLQRFWQVMADGGFITDAVAVIATSRRTGRRVLADAGGVRPRRGRSLKGRCLGLPSGRRLRSGGAAGESMRLIAALLGRDPSTISRELGRNLDQVGRYRATTAHARAYHRASPPKPAKLVHNLVLREKVEQDLEKKYSPQQIVGRLRLEFPDDPEMRVSTETIYQSLYVQSRGALRRELTACLRTGRALRRPSRKVGQRKNRFIFGSMILARMVNLVAGGLSR